MSIIFVKSNMGIIRLVESVTLLCFCRLGRRETHNLFSNCVFRKLCLQSLFSYERVLFTYAETPVYVCVSDRSSL